MVFLNLKQKMTTLKKILNKKGYFKIPLLITDTNHFKITANINKIEGRFILDTGASNSCINLDKVDFFNLSSKKSKVKATGAGASEMETKISTKNKIQIGDWKSKKIKIILFDLVHINEALVTRKILPVDGIIGADILIKGKAIIDYSKSCVYLK